MFTATSPNAGEITRLIETQLKNLPEVRAAIEAANAAAETQAASARKTVLDDLAAASDKLSGLEKIGQAVDADIKVVREKLQSLIDVREKHDVEIQQVSTRVRDLERRLRKEHGGWIVDTVLNQLHARVFDLREQTARLRQITIAPNPFGPKTPDPVSRTEAVKKEAQIANIGVAIRDIGNLSRQLISPQEMQRRVADAVRPLGLGLHVENVPATGWRNAGWGDGLVPDSVSKTA